MNQKKFNPELVNRTKIVGTLGPACSSEGTMQEMILAGLDVARINFSHGSTDANLELIAKLRSAAEKVEKVVPVMQDLQGPKIRTGDVPSGGLRLIEETIRVLKVGVNSSDGEDIPVPYQHLHEDVKKGDRILLDEGLMELEVISTGDRKVTTRVIIGGTLLPFQGLAVPTAHLSIESMTEKDREDLELGLKSNVDFVALSFVRTADDVVQIRKLIHDSMSHDVEPPAIIAKIEKHEAIDNFDEIVKEADAIMIARGDLGIETSFSEVPITQKELIAKSLIAGKPVITATDMMSSMSTQARPTRAEASDVANAVLDHTDAVMLSEETAMGRFPVKTVATMAEIIAKTEESPLDQLIAQPHSVGEPVPQAVSGAAVELARHVNASAIVVTTHSGFSARAVAQFRPEVPIIAATDNPRVQRQLQLSWGIEPLLADGYSEPEQMMRQALGDLSDFGVKKGVSVVVVSGLKRKEGGFDSSARVVEV